MGERAASLAFLAASGLYLAVALGFPVGSAAKPGPGFFPVAVGAFLCAVAILFLVTALRRRPRASGASMAAPLLSEGARGRAAATAGGLVGFCLLLPWIGYPLAAFLFVGLLLKRLGGGGWTAALAVALLAAAASYYLFAVLLGVPLPRGVWLD
jgi:hypothetical protein